MTTQLNPVWGVRLPQRRARRSGPRSLLILSCWLVVVAAPAEAAINLALTITPASISFPDANPSTAPTILANTSVQIRVEVGGATTDAWSVKALANGDLTSGPRSIAITNVTWTATKAGGSCNNNCSCTAGTASRTVPQNIIIGQGNTKSSGFTCNQSYSLANRWSYVPGSYSQTVTITAAAP